MLAYPASFPCPSRIEGHGQAIEAGLVRTPMTAGNSRQRRTHRVLPHRISLAFIVEQRFWANWLAWVNEHAWDEWIGLELPGLLASRAGMPVTSVPVRFCSDLQADLLPLHRMWYWRVRVDCEYLPVPEDLAIGWVIAGTPAAPSAPDWVLAGSPAAPSVDVINPGTPATTGVFA